MAVIEKKYIRKDWTETYHYGCGFRGKKWGKWKKQYRRIAKRQEAQAMNREMRREI